MKYLIILMGLSLSISGFAKIDYTHCVEEFNQNPQIGNYGFPFKLGSDGKVIKHPNANISQDDAGNEVISFMNGPGIHPHKVSFTFVKEGEQIVKVVQIEETEAPEYVVKPGVPPPAPGTFNQDVKNEKVWDFDVKNGKCYPRRFYGTYQIGKAKNPVYHHEVQLCREIKEFLDKNKELKNCLTLSNSGKVKALLDSHKERNSDYYHENFESLGVFHGFGGGFNGSGPNNPLPPPGIDSIVMAQDKKTNSPGHGVSMLTRLELLNELCNSPLGRIQEMVNDEDLWKEEADTKDTEESGSTDENQ